MLRGEQCKEGNDEFNTRGQSREPEVARASLKEDEQKNRLQCHVSELTDDNVSDFKMSFLFSFVKQSVQDTLSSRAEEQL